MTHGPEKLDTKWIPDGGAGWTIVYITASFPIGLILLTAPSWGPAAGVALITWPWWATWARWVRRLG